MNFQAVGVTKKGDENWETVSVQQELKLWHVLSLLYHYCIIVKHTIG